MTRWLTRLKVALGVQVISHGKSMQATFAVSQRIISTFGSRRSTGHESLTKRHENAALFEAV